MFTYVFWLGLSVWKFPSAQRCFSTALVCGALIPCPKSSSLVTVDKPVSSADGLYGDMPPHVLNSSGSLEFISTHPPQQHTYFPGKLSSPNGSHMPLVKLSSWKRRKIIFRLATFSVFLSQVTARQQTLSMSLSFIACVSLFAWRDLGCGLDNLWQSYQSWMMT